MASYNRHIRNALENHLNTLDNIPDVAWQNVNYSPTTGTRFLKPMFQPTSRRPANIGTNPTQRYNGIFTVLVNSPENEGPSAGEGVADTITQRFESTTDLYWDISTDSLLTESGYRLLLESGDPLALDDVIYVVIDYAEQNSPYTNSPWYVVPVTIGWHCHK
jgi:hypothetical protein